MKIPEIPAEFNLSTFLLDRHLEENRGGKIAIFYEDKSFTYEEVIKEANCVGNTLLELGVEQENRIMICLPDCP
ncbi:MAG: AMP-binding protein, partial [Firmicutes bacterium]|nr:AMP-binding protein [Bacillota bacterium]